jgi:hypothetical protein
MSTINLSEQTKGLQQEAERISTYAKATVHKSKTTLLLDHTLKKLAQVYAVQNDTTLQEVVEMGLRKILLEENK